MPIMPPMPLQPPVSPQAAFFIALLIAASWMDIRKRIVQDEICVLIALTGLIDFSSARLAGILAALPLLIAAICRQDSIGGGDIKLTAAAGFVLGFGSGIAGLIIGLSTAVIFHAVKRAVNWLSGCGENVDPSLPLAPFLSLGFIAAYFL